MSSLFILPLVQIVPVVLFVGAFALLFIVAMGNRGDADPTGSRPMAAYYFSAAFLFLWVAFAAVDFAMTAVIGAIGSHPGYGYGYASDYYTNVAIRSCVIGAMAVVIIGGAWWLHFRRGEALAGSDADPTGPTRRIERSYVALVSFVSVLSGVVALVVGAWSLFGAFSHSIFGGSSTADSMRGFFEGLLTAVLAFAIYAFHQRLAQPSTRLLAPRGPSEPDAAASAASGTGLTP